MNHAPLDPSKKTMIALLALATTCPIAQAEGTTGYLVPATAAGTSLVGPSAVYSNQSSITQRELARRKERTRQAMILLEEGRQAYKDKKYKVALDKYNDALTTLPNAPATADRRAFIIQSIGDASIAVAIEYAKIGRYDEAEQLLLDTLRNDPKNKRAQKELSLLRDPVRNNPALTPEHVKNVEEVNRLLILAYGYYDLGEYNKAYDSFNRVLLIDPYNEAARRGQEAVSKRRQKYYQVAHDAARAKALAEVEAIWEEKIPVSMPRMAVETQETIQVDDNVAANTEKLNSLHITNVNFEDTSIEDALDFLRGEFRKAGQTVNFIFERPVEQPAAVASASDDDDEDSDDSEEAVVATPTPREVSIAKLEMHDVSAKALLDNMCSAAHCQYRIDSDAVVVYPAGAGNEKLFRRTFPKITREFFADSSGDDDGGDDLGDEFSDMGSSKKKSKTDAKAALINMGVSFPKGAYAKWSPVTGVLTVNNTMENLDLVEEAIAEKRRSLPQMIKVSTKFVEIQQTNTEELGFDWVINPFSVSNSGNTFLGGGDMAQPTGTPTADMGSSSTSSDMIPMPSQYRGSNPWPNNSGYATGGLRTGTNAITGNSLDSLISSGSAAASQATTSAPGILSLTGIYNDGAYQMIMRGLSQKKGVDIMSAPSLLARPGEMAWTPQALPDQDEDDNCAKIEVVRRFIYPVAFDPPELNSSGNNGWNSSSSLPTATPANPSEWTTEEVGIVLRFRVAEGEGDSDIIKFDHFEIKVVDFEGFINYGSPIVAGIPSNTGTIDGNAFSSGEVTEVQLTENRIDMPIFQRRFINTNPCIYDGHTIVIGGLISENVQKVEDKVPVFGDLPLIGRFFRSNNENHVKKNMMVFVTAEKIDPTGQPTRERNTGVPAGEGGSVPSLFADDGLAHP